MKNSFKCYCPIFNMDETPLYFDIPNHSTYDMRGVKTVRMATTGNEKRDLQVF